MSTTKALKFTTIEEYLEMEDQSEEKHEYWGGYIYAMARAGISHNRILRNTLTAIDAFLRGKSCQVYPSDLKIHIEAHSQFTYPDLSIICGPPEFWNDRDDTVLNPAVIIEILSNSTQNYDRAEKFSLYRAIPSFREYILIHSRNPLLEHYIKQSPSEWKMTEYKEPGEMIHIDTIGFSTPLKELYRDVEFGNDKQ